jgi:hypothetical protein
MKRIILAALIGLLVSGPGHLQAAASDRTDQLLWQCTGQEMEDFGRFICAKYIDGILDMHAISVSMGGPALFCHPKTGFSVDQAMRIFVAWANQNPSELHKTARISVVVSMAQAFPCK